MIKLYIYRRNTGAYLYEDVGSIKGILTDLREDLDFTLVPYPTDGKHCCWNGTAWVESDTSELISHDELDKTYL